jgi:hypothetical protein
MLKLFKTTLLFFSFIISMTCGALAQIPNSPTQLVIGSKSASGFGLRWIDNSLNEQGFYIESKSPKEWRIVGIAPENAIQFSVGGVWYQTTKQYRVRAYNQNGKSQPSNTVKGKTLDNYPNKRSHLIDSTGARNGEGCFLKIDNRLWMYYSYRLEGGDEGQSQIVRRYSDDNGQNWSKREIVLKHPKLGYINPALVHLADNKIGLSYAEMVPHAAKAKRFFMASADGGKNWTNPVRIDNGEYDYNTGTHGRMYVLSNGRIIQEKTFGYQYLCQ